MTTPNIEELRLLAQTLEFSDAVRCSIQRAADLLQSQAERIAELEEAAEESSVDAVIIQYHEAAIKRLKIENDTLRAQLEAIAATEPIYYLGGGRLYGDKTSALFDNAKNAITELFTHPMPAQDVTELVEALENALRVLAANGNSFGASAQRKARTALSKYKGAK